MHEHDPQNYPVSRFFIIASFIIISIYTLLVCLSVYFGVSLFVCLYPIKFKTAELIGPKFCVGASHDPGEGLCMITISKVSLQQNSIFISKTEIPDLFVSDGKAFSGLNEITEGFNDFFCKCCS